MSASFLHFSRNEVEYVPKNGMELLRIGRDRIIFQYRPSIWAALTEYMPKDMIKRLDDVIRNERGRAFPAQVRRVSGRACCTVDREESRQQKIRRPHRGRRILLCLLFCRGRGD